MDYTKALDIELETLRQEALDAFTAMFEAKKKYHIAAFKANVASVLSNHHQVRPYVVPNDSALGDAIVKKEYQPRSALGPFLVLNGILDIANDYALLDDEARAITDCNSQILNGSKVKAMIWNDPPAAQTRLDVVILQPTVVPELVAMARALLQPFPQAIANPQNPSWGNA